MEEDATLSESTHCASADAATHALDLGGLDLRLVRRGHFTAAEAPVAIAAYRKFLALKVSLDDRDARLLLPPLAVDTVWCEHIRDTRGYAEACARALGTVSAMIHRDADADLDDADLRHARVQTTRNEFKRLFGADGLSGWAWAFERAEQ